MKLMSFAVPCYNSEEYMKKCIESLLKGGEDVEIIVVNDGSHDNYAARLRRTTCGVIPRSSRRCIKRTADTARA